MSIYPTKILTHLDIGTDLAKLGARNGLERKNFEREAQKLGP